MFKRPAPVAAIFLCVAVCAVPTALAEMPPQEQVTVLELPPVAPHWIAATSSGGSIMVTPITLIDGDSLRVMGTITGGMTAMFAASPDHKQFYTRGHLLLTRDSRRSHRHGDDLRRTQTRASRGNCSSRRAPARGPGPDRDERHSRRALSALLEPGSGDLGQRRLTCKATRSPARSRLLDAPRF